MYCTCNYTWYSNRHLLCWYLYIALLNGSVVFHLHHMVIIQQQLAHSYPLVSLQVLHMHGVYAWGLASPQYLCSKSGTRVLEDWLHHSICVPNPVRGDAGTSLAQSGRKQAAANKLGIYSTYSLQSSIHFLGHCSNFRKPPKKNSECCPSNQISTTAVTTASDEKWWPFNWFFSPGNRW